MWKEIAETVRKVVKEHRAADVYHIFQKMKREYYFCFNAVLRSGLIESLSKGAVVQNERTNVDFSSIREEMNIGNMVNKKE
jgi:hypothetical protein